VGVGATSQLVRPGAFVESAQAVEKMSDELPWTAKERAESTIPPRKRSGPQGWIPHSPGNSDDYQNKGLVNWAIRMIIKTRGLRMEHFV
jgi:hypothetical protein